MSEEHDPNEKLFARKAKKYWLLVTGGMILLGLVNLALGWYLWETSPRSYDDEPTAEEMPVIPPPKPEPPPTPDASPTPLGIDASVPAATDASVPDDGKR